MTDLRLFRQGADGTDAELTGSTVALGVELQRRVEAAMEALLGIQLVASEYPSGLWHPGRIDSLGLPKTGRRWWSSTRRTPTAGSCRRRCPTCGG